MKGIEIKKIQAREILSTGSFPTIETKITLENGVVGKASVPFGSSAGSYEAVTLVDHDPKRYHGLGMLKVVKNIEDKIAPKLLGFSITDQKTIDQILLELDGTTNKSNLGGNALTGVSLACARTASLAMNVPLYVYLRETYEYDKKLFRLPKPMMVVIEGGKHADNSTDFQEYMVLPIAPTKIKENIRHGVEVYQALRDLLKTKGYDVNVGYEGAYAITKRVTNQEPLKIINDAIKSAGYEPGKDVALGIDPAASEFYRDNLYFLQCEKRKLTSLELIDYYDSLVKNYPLISIEDGLDEDAWDDWSLFQKRLGTKILNIGDDLTVTNIHRLEKAMQIKAINSILIKPNQIGTLTETMITVKQAQKYGLNIIVSHRGGGETNDTFIVDLAVAVNANFLKVGVSRGERTEKYNRLLEIESDLEIINDNVANSGG